jgi:hypothetical protein
MRRGIAIFAAIGPAGAAAAAQAQNNSQAQNNNKDSARDSTNAAICAPADETAVSPEQRIAACTALIDTLTDAKGSRSRHRARSEQCARLPRTLK